MLSEACIRNASSSMAQGSLQMKNKWSKLGNWNLVETTNGGVQFPQEWIIYCPPHMCIVTICVFYHISGQSKFGFGKFGAQGVLQGLKALQMPSVYNTFLFSFFENCLFTKVSGNSRGFNLCPKQKNCGSGRLKIIPLRTIY